MKSYKGYSRAQLIDILADYAVFTATVNNQHGLPHDLPEMPRILPVCYV